MKVVCDGIDELSCHVFKDVVCLVFLLEHMWFLKGGIP